MVILIIYLIGTTPPHAPRRTPYSAHKYEPTFKSVLGVRSRFAIWFHGLRLGHLLCQKRPDPDQITEKAKWPPSWLKGCYEVHPIQRWFPVGEDHDILTSKRIETGPHVSGPPPRDYTSFAPHRQQYCSTLSST